MTARIRQDLKATPAEEQGVKYFDVADPRSGSKMRLYDFEWLIAEQLNGSRRFDEVAEYARDRLGIQPSPSDIQAYVERLAELKEAEIAQLARVLLEIRRARLDAQPLARPGRDLVERPPPIHALGDQPLEVVHAHGRRTSDRSRRNI